MKIVHICKFIISTLFCVANVLQSTAQQTENANGTKKYPDIYGLRIGIDMLSATRNIWEPDFKGIDVISDFRINKNWYTAIEAGYANKYKNEDRMDFTTRGVYVKIGADKNLHKNWLNMNNMLYVGGRYGVAFHQQTLHSYKIIIPGDYVEQLSINANKTSKNLHAHWVELVTGVKTEIYTNLFLGLGFRLHGLVYQKQPKEFENLYIPGFGKKYSGNIGASFNYSVSYLFPIIKKK